MTTIALVGPGAIGGTLAAWLTQVEGNDVTVCARTPFGRLVVKVPGGETIDVAPRVLTDPAAASVVDWVVVVTKTYDTAGAAHWLERLVGPATRVAVVQNGVEHRERFGDRVPPARLVPVVIDIPAERDGPGRIRQRRHGDVSAPSGEPGAAFAALFGSTPLRVSLTDDFLGTSWRKLVLNSAAVVSAVVLKPAGLVHNAKAAALMHAIATEALAVGRAVGAKLDDSIPDEVLARYRASPPDAVSSLLADRLAGRRTEIDARNGVIVRLGAAHGVATPLNGMAVTLIEAAE